MRALLVVLSVSLLSGSVVAAPIVIRDGASSGGSIVDQSDAWFASWTQTTTFTNVIIAARLGAGPNTASAFLTNQVGPGTTIANELASLTFTVPTSTELVTLFTLPTLGPGTYYLTLSSPDAFPGFTWWMTNAVPTIGTGSTLNPTQGVSGTPVAPYAPASSMVPQGRNLTISVTGDATVPEPSTILLTTLGLTLVVARRKR